MHWIAVHEEVLGSKLRGFRKAIKCSEAEALGILTVLWLWARKNADISGLLANTDIDDVADAIKVSLSNNLNSKKVAEELVNSGWLDDKDGQLYVHDWYEWQQYWYNYLDKKEKDKERKRLERERRRNETHQEEAPESEEPKIDEKFDAKSDEEKPKKPSKTKYGDSVRMLPEEHQKLVEKYGKEFTDKLVEELDNYKVASGKKYKDDYRAILNWVVEKCERKYPHLKKQESRPETAGGVNPYADYK